jgi:site-specific recombinase XerD
MDPARRCLPVNEWPELDRAAWAAAMNNNDPLSLERSIAGSWKPTTCRTYRQSYGRWLNFLKILKAERNAPADRVTQERVEMYIAALKAQGVAHSTLHNRIVDLLSVMVAFDPGRDWSWLKACVRQLERMVNDSASKSIPKVLTFDVIERAEKHLRRLRAASTQKEVLEFRDWLMLCMLATLPLRLRNFTRLSLGRHLQKLSDATWGIDIEGAETKTGCPFAGVIPRKLSRIIDHYLQTIRPKLEREKNDRLWLGLLGRPLAEPTVYSIVVGRTQREFGIAVNPHQFRRIFATSLCISDLDSIEGARAILGHSSRHTTRDHYARATGLTASRKHQELMSKLRRSFP